MNCVVPYFIVYHKDANKYIQSLKKAGISVYP